MQKNSDNKKKSRSNIGTSEPEQAIYFNVHRFFPDAVNRYKLKTEQEIVEADIFIPCINIAIEYDGKYWHRAKSKVLKDDQKNHIFNENGIYVIRVRDAGLPELDSFEGKVLIHGKPPEGMYITEIINHIINDLADYVDDTDKKKEMASFRMTYEDFLKERPDIEAPLYAEPKAENFTSDPWFKYWNYEMNDKLDPHNFDNTDSVFAWFTCPKGNKLIRLTQHSYPVTKLTNGLTVSDSCDVLKICPFLPHDSYLAFGTDCGNECSFVEERFSEMISDFILHGCKKETVNHSTRNELRYYPVTAFRGIEAYLHADEEGKERFNNVFIDINEKTKYRTFLPHRVTIHNADEAKELFEFIDMNDDLLIIFNWEILDTDEESRKLLASQIHKCFEAHEITASVYVEHLFSENNVPLTEELLELLVPILKKHNAYLGMESYLAEKYNEIK